jgi:tRNA pseudouridine38-40 synthase
MGKFYLCHTAYNGAAFNGWQAQPDQCTVQGEILKTLENLYPGRRVKAFAASRTDAGVHAHGQVVKILFPEIKSENEVKNILNLNLPKEIRITQCRRINPSFKVTNLVVNKEYWYVFSKKSYSKFPFSVQIPSEVDLEKMATLCHSFEGCHDFVNFQCRSTVKGDFKRKILKAEIIKLNELGESLTFPDDIYVFRVVGEGFLKQMVRLMVGALIKVSMGEYSREDLLASLSGEENKYVGMIAPGEGLFLHTMTYPVWENEKSSCVVDQLNYRLIDPDWTLWRSGITPQKINIINHDLRP